MLEVADVFRRYGDQYLRMFGQNMLPSHRRAFQDILGCQTQAMGGHLYVCEHCGREHYVYHSCRNRSCPKCHAGQTEAWLAQRREELLPVEYFHVIFTLPQSLRPHARRHQKVLYGILMKSAAAALRKLAADPRYVGGQIGILAILHTWGRTLDYHPHVHCLVPGGGVCADQRWLPARKGFLVPVKALSKLFRGIFMDLVRRELPQLTIPLDAWNQPWVVYCKPSVQGTEAVLNYLARYVHRVAITNSRILSIEDGKVTFRYQPHGNVPAKTMTLEANEFIRRFLQHVLPRGTHKVRYYGLWSPAKRGLLRQLQIALASEAVTETPPPPANEDDPTSHAGGTGSTRCRYCGKGLLLWVSRIPRQRRAPP